VVEYPINGLLCLAEVGDAAGFGDQVFRDIGHMLQQEWLPHGWGMSIAYSTADGIVWPYEVSLTRSPQFWDAKGPGRRAGRAPGLAAADRSTSNGEELIIMALLTTDHTVQRWERLESAEARYRRAQCLSRCPLRRQPRPWSA
jgi:hypothetical protein